MRATALFVVLLLSMPGLASAQDDWTDYVNVPDGFHVDFPGQPKITNITWDSWHQFKYPGHVYSVDQGNSHYSITVVDYATADVDGKRVLRCPPELEAEIYERPVYPWPSFRNVDLPILFLYGAGSYPFFPPAARLARRANAGVQVKTVPGHHCFMLEHPEPAHARVRQFLAGV